MPQAISIVIFSSWEFSGVLLSLSKKKKKQEKRKKRKK